MATGTGGWGGGVNLGAVNRDIVPETPNVFDIGTLDKSFRNIRCGGDLVIGGSLTVEGPITTIESVTLIIEDKNIQLASVDVPTDVLADGGGITIKGTTDKTWLYDRTTESWNSNLPIRTGNLELNGNTLSSITGDLDVTTQTGGVFKFVDNAFRAGLDASNYLEIGHGGSNAFINVVGAGGQDFRFAGVTKATFTPAGHLHLVTDTDQKHNLKLKTANNANDSGIAWENSGGNFSQTIFRTDVGSNRSDLVFAIGSDANIDLLTSSFKIHGSAANEGRLEVLGAFQISSGNPGIGKVWTDAGAGDGIGAWVLASGGGWTDAGATIILTTITDSVGLGTSVADSKFHVMDGGSAGTVTALGGTIATFESPSTGYLSILTPDANERGIFFGEPASNVAGGIIYNSSTAPDGFEFRVNGNLTRMTVSNTSVIIPTQLNVDNIRIDGNTISSQDTNGNIELSPNGTGGRVNANVTGGLSVGGFPSGGLHVTSTSASVNGNAVITGHNLFGGNKQLWYLGSTSSSNDNIALINRQAAEAHIHTSDLSRFEVKANGDLRFNVYPNTRDDGTPTNILGTDVNGNLISGPNEVVHIGGNFTDTVDQSIVTANTSQSITFNQNRLIDDIGHTVGSDTFTINTSGVYQLMIAPQLGQGSGAAVVEFWIEKNGVDIVDSNIQLTIGANSQTLPFLRWKEQFVATDTFKIIWASNSVNTRLDNITSSYSGPNIPSIMLGVTHQGSVAA